MSNNESMEMYLETVYVLENIHGHAHGVDIAKQLNVSKPSVTKAIKHLKEQGLVDTEKYGTITLTEEGKKISEKIYSNHQFIALFLEKALELSAKEAGLNACKIEHVLSDEMMQSIKSYLKKNKIDLQNR